ncbi:MAG: alpha/beta fold hydrolase [Pseudomonadota bacterium]
MNAERQQTSNGTPIWIRGNGPSVILAHGVLMDHRMWQPQVDALCARFRVCCYDMLGHGEAPLPPDNPGLDDYVAQTAEVVEHLREFGQPVLGGFSMGGLITQAYAATHHAGLRGVMILNAVYDRSPEQSTIVRSRSDEMRAGGPAAALDSARRRWFTEDDFRQRADAVSDILSWIEAGDFAPKTKAHRVFSRGDADVTGTLGEISCPALVMTGEDDAGSTPEMARKIAAAIPTAELHILPGQRHMMTVLDAARVNDMLLRFLTHIVR